jgi:hypothetical protein
VKIRESLKLEILKCERLALSSSNPKRELVGGLLLLSHLARVSEPGRTFLRPKTLSPRHRPQYPQVQPIRVDKQDGSIIILCFKAPEWPLRPVLQASRKIIVLAVSLLLPFLRL